MLLMFGLSGCSVLMAWKQPAAKNLSVLAPGTSRDTVIAEFGPPISSSKIENGQTKEIFVFVQGYSRNALEARGYLHAAGDVMTLGLWEIVGTPLEAHFDGKKMTVSVIFDPKNMVVESTILDVTDPHPTEFAAIRDTIVGDSDTPKYSYAPAKDSSMVVSSGDPAPDGGNAAVIIRKVDGYFANFVAASPSSPLRFLESKKPLYVSPEEHAFALEFTATESAESYVDAQGGTVNGYNEIDASDVRRLGLLPKHVYRFTSSCSHEAFQVDFWDVTAGEKNRTHVDGWTYPGAVHFKSTIYTPPPDK